MAGLILSFLNDTNVVCGILASSVFASGLFLAWLVYRRSREGRRCLALRISCGATMVMGLGLFALTPFLVPVLTLLFVRPEPTGLDFGPRFETLDELLVYCDGIVRSETQSRPWRYLSARDFLGMLEYARAQQRTCAAAGWVPAVPVSGRNPCVGRAPGVVLDPRNPEASVVPDSLFELGVQPDAGGYVVDDHSNVMIAFLPDSRPYDGSRCWMYLDETEPLGPRFGRWYASPWAPP